jgi:hypothetical protein
MQLSPLRRLMEGKVATKHQVNMVLKYLISKPFVCLAISFTTAFFLQGCTSTSGFDLPEDSHGPTVQNIVDRVRCELTQMVADYPERERNYPWKEKLLKGNYKVAATMTLDVTDAGELAPSLKFLPTETFSFGAGFKLSETRTQDFNEDLVFSLRELRDAWKTNPSLADCPDRKTLLAGDLGLRTTVDIAFSGSNRDTSPDPKSGEFGGYVNFSLERNVNGIGPIWSLVHFNGPGGFAKFGRTNTDKLTFAFAKEAEATNRTGTAPRAKQALEGIKLNSIDQLLTKMNLSPQ